MMRWLFILVLLASALGGLAACAAKEKAPPAPAAPAPAAPAPATPAPAAKPAWEQEWERLLAAAKQEGKVVVAGPAGPLFRKLLTEPFEKKFGIPVEFMAGRGGEQAARILAEREAGQYLWDVYIGGSSTPLVRFKPAKAMDPIEPAFILPEVKDPKNWRGGKYPFLDKEGRLVFAMIGQTTEVLYVNSNLVDPKEFKSLKQLLEPKWKGKITIGDPTVTGAAQGVFQFYYLHRELGPDFIRALLEQDPLVTRDSSTQLRWVAAGRYPVCIGCSTTDAEPLMRAGAPLGLVTPKQVKEGGYVGTSVGTLALLNRAPHPNAAKVYINWLLSKEGQTQFVQAGRYLSRRVDVALLPGYEWMVPAETDIPTDSEEARLQREELVKFFKELLGGR